MDITIVSAIDPSAAKPSGTKAYVMNLLRDLLKSNADITLIGVEYDRSFHACDGYKFIPIVKDKRISSLKFLINLFLKAPFLDISDSSIIHTQRPDDMLPFILFYRKNPKIFTSHGRNFKGEFKLKKGWLIGTLFELIESMIIKRVDRVVATDEKTRDFYLGEHPWLRNKIVTIPVGIDNGLFKPMDKRRVRRLYGLNIRDKIILYVGRFGREKRLDFLIRSFERLKRELDECKLVLVGEGYELKNLKKIVEELGLKKDVIFLGAMEHEKVPEIMNCADVFALTSLYESAPLVVLEALACGVPVVATDVGRVSEFITNRNVGRIVRGNEEEFAKAMEEAIRMDPKKTRDRCREVAMNFSFRKTAEQLNVLYRELIDGRGR
jgi:glycosyltransferase involved in cell wall biosynthesis